MMNSMISTCRRFIVIRLRNRPIFGWRTYGKDQHFGRVIFSSATQRLLVAAVRRPVAAVMFDTRLCIVQFRRHHAALLAGLMILMQ